MTMAAARIRRRPGKLLNPNSKEGHEAFMRLAKSPPADTSRKAAIDFLKKTGMYDDDGQLKEEFR